MTDLPAQLGPKNPGEADPDDPSQWRWQQIGEDQVLEEETLQIAGCTDYMYRNYIDNSTGVALTVLVSFGVADRIYPHSPLVCFPANGFQPRGGPWQRTIEFEGASPEEQEAASFKALVYGKPSGGYEELREVYYSFWHDGRWQADQPQNLFRHRPAMFKIQVERPIIPGEARGEGSRPIEGFLRDLIPEIERRYAASQERNRKRIRPTPSTRAWWQRTDTGLLGSVPFGCLRFVLEPVPHASARSRVRGRTRGTRSSQ